MLVPNRLGEQALLADRARDAGSARDAGKFRWTGYGENSRVLARIFNRLSKSWRREPS
jgi:hypothetical protein